MEIRGSCHCEKVTFTAVSHTPVPYLRCYCSICRKCLGGGGYAVDILAEFKSFKVDGEEYVKVYRAITNFDTTTNEPKLADFLRYFCGECGCHLYGYYTTHPNNVYPMASAIDTPLPAPEDKDIHRIWLGKDSICNWVQVPEIDGTHNFVKDSNMTATQWHKDHNEYIS